MRFENFRNAEPVIESSKEQSNLPMRIGAVTHVPASRLWQCVCGVQDLPASDYNHLNGCTACEVLITELAAALAEIAERYPAGRSGSTLA